MSRSIQFLYSLYGFTVFLAFLFLLFPLTVIASFFGKIRGGNMIYAICRFWGDACFFFWGIRHKNYFEAPHDPLHPVVFVFNHISYIDIPVIMKTFRRQHIRVLGKSEM